MVPFDRLGLKTNVLKTLGIVCHPHQAVKVQVDKEYNWQMTGVGRR